MNGNIWFPTCAPDDGLWVWRTYTDYRAPELSQKPLHKVKWSLWAKKKEKANRNHIWYVSLGRFSKALFIYLCPFGLLLHFSPSVDLGERRRETNKTIAGGSDRRTATVSSSFPVNSHKKYFWLGFCLLTGLLSSTFLFSLQISQSGRDQDNHPHK